MSTALVQSRIDTEIKRIAEEDFKKMGFDAATAIRMFYAHVARTHSVPVSLDASSDEPKFVKHREIPALKRIKRIQIKSDEHGNWIMPKDMPRKLQEAWG